MTDISNEHCTDLVIVKSNHNNSVHTTFVTLTTFMKYASDSNLSFSQLY